MTRLTTTLLLLLLAASASGGERQFSDKCCRMAWRSRHTGFIGHGEWTKEFYAMSWLRTGCFLPSRLRDLDEWVEIRSKGWFGRVKIREYRQPCGATK